jgi:DNA-binding MarR family transcriptional regulator
VDPVPDAFDDDRLTEVGLFFEAHNALAGLLVRHLESELRLPASWFEVLLRLARTPEHRLRMTDLAAQTTLSTSGHTRLVDRLEEAELVRREQCDTDRRVAYAVLTSKGLKRVRVAVPAHLDQVQQHFTGVLSEDERAALAASLRKLRDALNPCVAAHSPPRV